jgi:hypothetical protein
MRELNFDFIETELERVDWECANGAGSSRRFSDAIRKIARTGEASRGVQFVIEDHILPHSEICELTYYAIPILLELLAARCGVESLYDLMVSIAAGSEPGPYSDELLLGVLPLAKLCRARLAEGGELFFDDAANSELPAAIRDNAIFVLATVPELKERYLHRLRRLAGNETDATVRRSLQYHLEGL